MTPDEEAQQGRVLSREMQKAELYAATTRECDLVMKGGIASGVVYPLTVCKLATTYRLRNIGGTSAGAIAAVLAGAAEHRRQENKSGEGFAELAALPRTMAADLEELFTPNRSAGPLFALLKAPMGRSGIGRVARVVATLVIRRVAWFVLGFVGSLAVVLAGLVLVHGVPDSGDEWDHLTRGLLPALLPALLIGLAAAGVGMVLLAQRVLPGLDFGLTNGVRGEPRLSTWMHHHINVAAGREATAAPVTLGDLWGEDARTDWTETVARSVDAKMSSDPEGRSAVPPDVTRRKRAVDLQMMTTDLTTGRPIRLPFQDHRWFFDAAEFEQLFPAEVVDTMKITLSGYQHPQTGARLWYFPGPGGPVSKRAQEHGVEAGWLPDPSNLPLVVMARMSLSFPGLISAVPLYKVDFGGDATVVRHLFSDGGIGSNFPMHFFDSLLPSRPTFGVNLMAPHPAKPSERTKRPTLGNGEHPRVRRIDSLGGFASALRDTVQNWSDNAQVRQKGYADRVVEIRLDKSEGGMNLTMGRDAIDRMVARGGRAGEELLAFDADWRLHQVVRYRIAMARLTEALEIFGHHFDEADYDGLLKHLPNDGPASSFVKGVEWRKKDRAATDDLLKLVEAWEEAGWPAISKPRPSPSPSIRMSPQ